MKKVITNTIQVGKKIPVKSDDNCYIARWWWVNQKFEGLFDWIELSELELEVIRAKPQLTDAILTIASFK